MKNFAIALTVLTLLMQGAVYGVTRATTDWHDTIDSAQGQFAVSVHRAEKKIEVKKITGTKSTPPYLRVRILRENDRPLELALKTIDRTNSPLSYTAHMQEWNNSYIGLEIDFSFDRKTWKRLGKTLRKIVP